MKDQPSIGETHEGDDARAVTEGAEHAQVLIARNVETLASVRARAERGVNRHQRTVERVTGFLARPMTIYAVLVAITIWVTLNVAMSMSGRVPPDPAPFFWMQGVVGLGALLSAIMVLTTQMRLMRHSEERAHLDLQVNLSAEQKTAKLIALVEELRRDLPNVRNRRDSVAEAMSEAVDPHAVMSALKETFELAEDEPDSRRAPSTSS